VISNSIEIIKTLRQYPHPADFFKDKLPEYVRESGDSFIQVRRAFHEIMGYPVGINAGKYQEKLFDVHLMSLINALRELEEQGKVERKTRGLWIWRENGGENE